MKVPSEAPALVEFGCCVNDKWKVGAPIVKPALSVPVSAPSAAVSW